MLAGDVTGPATAAVVSKVRGVTVSAATPTAGQALAYSGGRGGAPRAGADAVTGPATAAVVSKVRGVTVSAATPTAGQVLAYSGGQWTPQAVSITASQVSDFAPSEIGRASGRA